MSYTKLLMLKANLNLLTWFLRVDYLFIFGRNEINYINNLNIWILYANSNVAVSWLRLLQEKRFL